MNALTHDRLIRYFDRLTARPGAVLGLALVCIALAAAGLSRLEKDTSLDAFIPRDHHSIQANDLAREVFGVSDPIAVAVIRRDGASIFNPEDLSLIDDLSRRIADLPNVREDRVASLATESAIHGADGELLVDAYIDGHGPTLTDAQWALELWRAMPPHVATLASADASGAVILAEVVDPDASALTYDAILGITAELSTPHLDILVAGPAAVSGVLSQQIDADARVLQPLVFVVVLTFLFLAFLRVSSLLGPSLLVVGAAGGALGLMAWQGIPYFAITNALPVIIVSISVADAIHVLSAYHRHRAMEPSLSAREATMLAMAEMTRPITLTTLTTMAGFVGIALVSIMPPIVYFAWFAALGVALAWVLSIFVLPCALVLLKPATSPAFLSWRRQRADALGRWFTTVGVASSRRPGFVLAVLAAAIVIAAAGALELRVDRSQVENFSPQAPIRIADERINASFAGTAFLDVIVESDAPDGLLSQPHMAKIAGLQDYFESLPYVEKTVSIVDYLSLMHAAMSEVPASDRRSLPDQEHALAQYLLVYEASGDPSDLDEEITPDYDKALVRGILNTPHFSRSRGTVEALQTYLAQEFNEPGLEATLAGSVNTTYHWMTRLQSSHFSGVGLALLMVLAMSTAAFRSIGAGVFAVVPVAFTVLVLYALMGYLDIYLEPATSMFAAISIGVGVDFAIHLVDRIRAALALHSDDLTAAIASAMPATSRACFFNAAALGIGFTTLMASDLPTLQRFGGLVSAAVLASFLASLVLVPALFGFARMALARYRRAGLGGALSSSVIGPILLTLGLVATPEAAGETPEAVGETPAAAGDTLTGRDIAERVAARAEGRFAHRVIDMTLTDRRGRERKRQALVLRETSGDLRQTRITYVLPKSVREVTFLSHDYRDPARTDDRWLYLPATRKVRRIPASGRGDHFLGTDFTYEDLQSDLKFELADYEFDYGGSEQRDGRVVHTVSGVPVSRKVARELGYGGFVAVVDAASWMPLEIRFDDPQGEPLKQIRISDIRRVDGLWTAHRIQAVNHQTGHRTLFEISRAAYPDGLPERLFTAAALTRGIPEL